MICPNCNKQIEDGSRFCEYCGANFAGAPQQPPVQGAPPPGYYPPQQPYYPPQQPRQEGKLYLDTVLKEGLAYGLKNIPSLLGALVLWVLTCWIPYINVGTTIAIMTIPLMLSRGEVFSPTSIFDKKYYRYMGEYFLTNGLMFIGIVAGVLFGIIPGIVIGIAWSLAILLLLDKGVNAAEAIRLSNKLTYGNKWTIFGVYAVAYIAYFIVYAIIYTIFFALIRATENISFISGFFSFLLVLLIIALIVIYFAFMIGCQASIYGTLSKNIKDQH